jgi:hypothetical protein
MSLPPFLPLAPVFIDETTCINWMLDYGIIDTVTQYIVCSGDVRYIGTLFHCRFRNCRKQVSAPTNSFFAGLRLRCNEVLLFGYYWIGGCTRSQSLRFTGFGRATVTEYLQHFRQLVSGALEEEDALGHI